MTPWGFLPLFLRQDARAIRKRADNEDRQENFVKSAALWRVLAERGDPEACHVLAERYEIGRGVIQNVVEATRWFHKAADGGHVLAQAKLGDIYFHGRSAPASVSPEGTVSEEDGSVKAAGLLGRLFPAGLSVPQDYSEAAKWNLLAAEAGDTHSQLRRAYQCASGLGVDKDYAEAKRWFAAAAEKGHDGGAFGLGILYGGGHVGEVDLGEAVSWLQRAADGGNSGALLSLGTLYWRGEGVAKDDERAAPI